MKVAEIMTRQVHLLRPDQTIQEAARKMSEEDVGALPIAEDDHLIGMITDRDIAVRAVGEGRSPVTRIREVMTEEVRYCFEDEDVAHVSENLADIQIRRLPVMDRNKRLVGVVSLADFATKGGGQHAKEALRGISRST